MVAPLCGCFGGPRRPPSPPPFRQAQPISSFDETNTKTGQRVCAPTVAASQSRTGRGDKRASGDARPHHSQLDTTIHANLGSRCLSAVATASAEASQALQNPAGFVCGDRELDTRSKVYDAQQVQAHKALSTQSLKLPAQDCLGDVADGSEHTHREPQGAIPALPTGQLQAELSELVYIGQGATGLVYRASVVQPCCDAAGVPAPLLGPVSVAVKFMICNTPQQLWQRAKEALLSKLVSHPNLVRTLAMDVTLVTPNTYRDWDLRQTALIEATGLAANLACADGAGLAPHTPAIPAAAGLPSGSPGASSVFAAAAAAATAAARAAGPIAATDAVGGGAEASSAVTEMTNFDQDNSDALPAVTDDIITGPATHPDPPAPASQPQAIAGVVQGPRVGDAFTGADVSAPPQPLGLTAAAPLPPQPSQVEQPPRAPGALGSRSQGALPARTLGSVMAAAVVAAQGGFALGSPAQGGEAPCTVEQGELWPGGSGSSASGMGSNTVSKAPSAALERSWPHTAGGGSGSGGGHVGCGAPGGGDVLRLQLSSGLVRSSGMPGAVSGGVGGGSGSDGSACCMLSASGDGESEFVPAKAPGAALVAAATGGKEDVGGTAGPAMGLTVPPPALRQEECAAGVMAATALSMPASSGRTLLAPDHAVAAALQGLRGQYPHGSGDGSLAAPGGPRPQQQLVGAGEAGNPTGGGSGSGGGAGGGAGGGGSGSQGGGAHRSGPVPFQDILYHLDALPGRFLSKVIMEYCDSGTLLQRINAGDYVAHPDKGPLAMLSALRALLWCLQEVAAGMAHLHSLNIIHGDLKPGNVLLTTQPGSPLGYVCKVSDFGLATALEASEQTITHENWGTVVYMAPESCAGRCRKASDVYSFGVLLWQMVTGERPYAGLQAGQVLLGVKTGTLKLQWPAWANKSLTKVGQACLRFEPKERPGFKGIRSALTKIAVRLDQKIAAESAGVAQAQAGAALLLQSASSSTVTAAAAAQGYGVDGGGVGGGGDGGDRVGRSSDEMDEAAGGAGV